MNDDTDAPSLRTASLMRVLLDALAFRALKFLTMLLAASLAFACVARPHWISLAATALYVALVLPMWWRREKRDA